MAKAAPPHFVARPEAAPFFIFAALSVALPVALPVVWWRCLRRCLPRCRSVVALPAASGRPGGSFWTNRAEAHGQLVFSPVRLPEQLRSSR